MGCYKSYDIPDSLLIPDDLEIKDCNIINFITTKPIIDM